MVSSPGPASITSSPSLPIRKSSPAPPFILSRTSPARPALPVMRSSPPPPFICQGLRPLEVEAEPAQIRPLEPDPSTVGLDGEPVTVRRGPVDHDRVAAGLAVDDVAAVAVVPDQRVVAIAIAVVVTSAESVATEDDVVAAEAGHAVAAVPAQQRVLGGRADDRVVTPVAVGHGARQARELTAADPGQVDPVAAGGLGVDVDEQVHDRRATQRRAGRIRAVDLHLPAAAGHRDVVLGAAGDGEPPAGGIEARGHVGLGRAGGPEPNGDDQAGGQDDGTEHGHRVGSPGAFGVARLTTPRRGRSFPRRPRSRSHRNWGLIPTPRADGERGLLAHAACPALVVEAIPAATTAVVTHHVGRLLLGDS